MQYLGYIVLSLLILLLMVLIHEAGHYTVAKIFGFTVDEFSVGFGPKIFSKRRKNGEMFSLRMLPLGGYCAFLGEDEETEEDKQKAKESKRCKRNASDCDINIDVSTEQQTEENNKIIADKKSDASKSDKPEQEDLLSFVMRAKTEEKDGGIDKVASERRADEEKPVRLDKDGNPAKTFNQQKPYKRILVLLGGVVFNFLSAIIFSLIYIWSVGYSAPLITEIYRDDAGAPYNAEIEVGDIILSVDGNDVSVMNSFTELAADIDADREITIEVLRGGRKIEIRAAKKSINAIDDDGKPYTYIGFGFLSQNEFIGNNAGNAFKYCVPYTFKLSWSILGSFGELLTGRVPITSVSGPIGSINTMAQLSIANWRNILILLPLLASNLAIFNLLPFPALDGARIVFTVIEWIRGKPLNRKVEGMIHFVGMVVLLLFVLIVDILSFVL